jgi:hypothetical protein
MSRGKWIGLCVALLLLLGGGVFAYGYFREDPQLAAVRALGEQMRDKGWENVTDDQRRQMRDAMDSLSDEQRDALWAEREQEMMAREDQRLAEFFALSAEEQRKALDEEIKRDEERRKQWEQRRRERENSDRQRGDGDRANGDRGRGGPGGRDGFRGGPPGGRGGRSSDPTVRNERRRERLDRSTPQSRARRAEHRRLIAERRTQMGLPPNTRGPRRG